MVGIYDVLYLPLRNAMAGLKWGLLLQRDDTLHLARCIDVLAFRDLG